MALTFENWCQLQIPHARAHERDFVLGPMYVFSKKKSPLYSDSDFIYTVRVFWALTVFYFENFVSHATCLEIFSHTSFVILKNKFDNFFEAPL
jgi:hypothetical protein